jgi:peptide/nickel transport system substrate-binding protein
VIWQEGFNLPLFQSPGDIAVRSDLANYGAPRLAEVVYTAIGFTRDPALPLPPGCTAPSVSYGEK